MKKIKKSLGRLIVIGAFASTLTGCFGEFAVTKAIYNFHKGIGGQDMMGGVIRSIPLWIPIGEAVYAIGGLADIVVFNLIEFWTGSNPLAMSEGEMEQQLVVKDGKTFNLIAQKNKFTIQELNADMQVKATTELVYDEIADSWVAPQENGELVVLNTLNFETPEFLLAKN